MIDLKLPQVRIWQTEHPGKVIRLDQFGDILNLAIRASFKPQTVINGFRVCGLYPFDADAVDYTKCIAGKQDDQPSSSRASKKVEESVLIPCRDIQNAVNTVSIRKAALYRLVDPDDFATETEKAVCFIYKTILAPFDQRNIPDEATLSEPEEAAVREPLCDEELEFQNINNSITFDQSSSSLDYGSDGRSDKSTQTDTVDTKQKSLDQVSSASESMQTTIISQQQLTDLDRNDFCR